MEINSLNNIQLTYRANKHSRVSGSKVERQHENSENVPQEKTSSLRWKIANKLFGFLQKDFINIKLADNIEFEPAETIQEAKKFAYKNLGIMKYDLTDVDSANYVNEALCNYYNQSSNKHAIIDAVGITDTPSTIASIKIFDSTLRVNQDVFQNVDSYIDTLFGSEEIKEKIIKPGGFLDKRYNLTEGQRSRLEKYRNNPCEMSLKEKIGFASLIQNVADIKLSSPMFSGMFKNKEASEYLKSKGFNNIEDVRKLSAEDCRTLIKEVFDNTSYRMSVPDGGDFININHEIGHKMHARNIGAEKFYDLAYAIYQKNDSKEQADLKTKQGMQRFMKEEPEWYIVCNVSPYSLTSPAEFVAETFACLANGAKFDDDTMRLFEKYGGVAP